MSRPQTPRVLKVLRGTERRDRVNPNEPRPPKLTASSRPPAWLRDRRARQFWRELLPVVHGMGIATVADPVALALLCDALAEYVAARDEIRANGSTYTTTNQAGGEMVRTVPEVAIAGDAWRRAKVMLGEFGLSPASRGRVSGAPAEGDEIDRWMAGRA